jgi:hypothetical protein
MNCLRLRSKISARQQRKRLDIPLIFFVLRIDGVYILWYGSYWSERPSTTAIGFAASLDGLKWYKHSDNPVLRPEPLSRCSDLPPGWSDKLKLGKSSSAFVKKDLRPLLNPG